MIVNGYQIVPGADLRGADLSGADLSGADLTGARLDDADLKNANLTGANLKNANLYRARLDYANLTNAYLTGAYLYLADIHDANLTNADLEDATLKYATLESNLTNANLTNADLTGAFLTGAELTNANLTNANLTNADLFVADLTNANLTNADLTGALLFSADLSNTQLNYNTIDSIGPGLFTFPETLDGSSIAGTLDELKQILFYYSNYLNSSMSLTISDIEQLSNSDIADLQASTTATVVDSLNPVLISASTSTDGTTVTLEFDESVSGDNTSVDHFEISGDRVIEIASLSIDGDTVTLNISDDTPIREGDNQTLSLAVESISDSSGNAASLSAVDITNNSTVSAANIIPSIVSRGRLKGRNRLKGTDDADLFTFHEFDLFKRRNADLIINFNPSQGDKISISADALPSLEGADEISFASARTGRERRKFSRQEIDLVYCEKTGRLLANGNGKGRRWGNRNEGGLMAILQGAPKLTSDNFTLLGGTPNIIIDDSPVLA